MLTHPPKHHLGAAPFENDQAAIQRLGRTRVIIFAGVLVKRPSLHLEWYAHVRRADIQRSKVSYITVLISFKRLLWTQGRLAMARLVSAVLLAFAAAQVRVRSGKITLNVICCEYV